MPNVARFCSVTLNAKSDVEVTASDDAEVTEMGDAAVTVKFGGLCDVLEVNC
jgi:hypothetical protein